MTHICNGKLTIIGSDNGLSPGRHQAVIRTNARLLLIRHLGTNCEILIGIQTFSFKKMHLKLSSAKWRPFCLGLNVLKRHDHESASSGSSVGIIPILNDCYVWFHRWVSINFAHAIKFNVYLPFHDNAIIKTHHTSLILSEEDPLTNELWL